MVHSTTPEHLLTVVEPIPGGDESLELAHDTVERGGQASVVMLITKRVRRHIDDYARAENLDLGHAEVLALDQLERMCTERIGADVPITAEFHRFNDRNLTAGVTAIAVPERLVRDRSIRRLARRAGVPVVVAPHSSAVPAAGAAA